MTESATHVKMIQTVMELKTLPTIVHLTALPGKVRMISTTIKMVVGMQIETQMMMETTF